MRVVTPEVQVEFDRKLKAGVSYVVHPKDAGSLVAEAGGLASVEACQLPEYDENADYNGRIITILKDGMVGDIFLLRPFVDEIRKKWPDVVIEICSRIKTEVAVHSICSHLPYPAEHSELLKRDAVLNLTTQRGA
jgi:hypothetical protein